GPESVPARHDRQGYCGGDGGNPDQSSTTTCLISKFHKLGETRRTVGQVIQCGVCEWNRLSVVGQPAQECRPGTANAVRGRIVSQRRPLEQVQNPPLFWGRQMLFCHQKSYCPS